MLSKSQQNFEESSSFVVPRFCSDLGGVAEQEPPEHHDAADGHQNDAHDGAQLQSHPAWPLTL